MCLRLLKSATTRKLEFAIIEILRVLDRIWCVLFWRLFSSIISDHHKSDPIYAIAFHDKDDRFVFDRVGSNCTLEDVVGSLGGM